MKTTPINLTQKLSLFADHWNPKIIGELNGQYVKLAKIQGSFTWHSHALEDELFYVIKGTLVIEFRDRIETIQEGEMMIIPKGVEHKPMAEEEVHIMLFEPVSTRNTGDTTNELTKESLHWI